MDREGCMKIKIFFYLTLLVWYVLLTTNVFSQEIKDQKKSLDAFITATTKSTEKSEPVPGAEITVEQVRPDTRTKASGSESGPAEKTQFDVILKSKFTTNDKGEFTLTVTQEQFKKLPDEFSLKFIIKPKDTGKYPADANSVVVKVKKSNGPNFDFVVTWQKLNAKTSNKGTFAVNGRTQM